MRRVGSGEYVYRFSTVLSNAGNTPGTITAVAINYKVNPFGAMHDPSDQEFLGTLPEFIDMPIAPKAEQNLRFIDIKETEIFENELGADLSKFPTTKATGSPIFWGWIAYRDTLPGSRLHVTEFCEGSRSASVSQGNVHFENGVCGKHNCSDEGCSDYSEIVRLAATKP